MKPEPPKVDKPPDVAQTNGIVVRGEAPLTQSISIAGVIPQRIPYVKSIQITAALPDGRVQPLVWLYEYRDKFRHPFLFRKPIDLPAGTTIRGLPVGTTIKLLRVNQ